MHDFLWALGNLLEKVGDRTRVYIERRDIWVGVFVGDKGITYICLLPCVVIAWKRKKARHA